MKRFPTAAAQGAPPEQMLADCISQLGTIPADANLGFLYASDTLAKELRPLLMRLMSAFPGVRWVGGVGMGICSSGEEFYDQPALVLMVGSFPEKSFRLLAPTAGGESGADASLSSWMLEQPSCFALLHGDPSNTKTVTHLEDLAQSAPNSFINGGLTSSNGENLQIAERVVNNGLSGVIFNHQVAVVTDHTQGCTPIGPVHTLTETRRNIAIKLDDRPALEVLKEDIGEVLSRDIAQSAGYIFTALPIEGSDTGDYLVRNLIAIDEENGLLAVSDYLEQERRLMFCRRDGNSAREDMQRMLQRLQKRIAGSNILGGIYVSCLGRGRYQFGNDSAELKIIREGLGDFPLVGYFANGEIYNGRLYGYTGVLTLFTDGD